MKSRIARGLALTLAIAAAACSRGPDPEVDSSAPAPEWIRPPAIRSVRQVAGGLVFQGLAQPGARVVLRADGGDAYAAAADEAGRFEIRIPPPAGHLLLRPETQQGQDAIPSPETLLIVDGGRGPVVLLRSGGATRRLDRGAVLDAVDSDGRVLIASGRTAERRPPRVGVDGRAETVAVLQPDGRWTALLGPEPRPGAAIRVGAAAFTWPGDAPAAGDLTAERAGAGWRVGWRGPADGRQSTWLPDAAG